MTRHNIINPYFITALNNPNNLVDKKCAAHIKRTLRRSELTGI